MNDSGVVEALDCGSQLLCNVECPGSVFRSGTECLVRAYQWVAERNFLIQGSAGGALGDKEVVSLALEQPDRRRCVRVVGKVSQLVVLVTDAVDCVPAVGVRGGKGTAFFDDQIDAGVVERGVDPPLLLKCRASLIE